MGIGRLGVDRIPGRLFLSRERSEDDRSLVGDLNGREDLYVKGTSRTGLNEERFDKGILEK